MKQHREVAVGGRQIRPPADGLGEQRNGLVRVPELSRRLGAAIEDDRVLAVRGEQCPVFAKRFLDAAAAVERQGFRKGCLSCVVYHRRSSLTRFRTAISPARAPLRERRAKW